MQTHIDAHIEAGLIDLPINYGLPSAKERKSRFCAAQTAVPNIKTRQAPAARKYSMQAGISQGPFLGKATTSQE